MTGSSTQLNGQSFMGCPRTPGRSNGTRTMALFGGGKSKGGAGTKVLKQAQKGSQKATQTLKKGSQKTGSQKKGPGGPQRAGGSSSYTKFQGKAKHQLGWASNSTSC